MSFRVRSTFKPVGAPSERRSRTVLSGSTPVYNGSREKTKKKRERETLYSFIFPFSILIHPIYKDLESILSKQINNHTHSSLKETACF